MLSLLRPRYLILGGVAGVGATEWIRRKLDHNSIGIVRFGRAAIAAGGIAYDYQTSVYRGKLPTEEDELQQVWSGVHKRSAERLLRLCRENRGVFVKVGQHLGALDYLLPQEYIQTLRILHNQAPVSSIKDVYQVIKEDLKLDKSQLFTEFDEEPLGAASLAQVYKAKLRTTGETVAVKVQHRDVRGHANVDIATMEILVRLAAWAFPDFKLLWLAEETKKNLPMELDFLNEGKNADKIAGLFTHCKWLRIPKIYWNVSSTRVLIMEYCEGGQVNDLEYMQKNKISGSEVASKLGQLYSEMIFVNGCVHCDPHPGNILVRNNKGALELSLLDHGLYTTLSPEFRYNYSKFWLSILSSDVKGIEEYGKELGVGDLSHLFACMVTARSWDSIASTDGITKQKLTSDEQEKIRKNIGNFLPQISEILERVPRPMIMIFKTNDLLRGVEYALKTQKTMTSFTTMSKFCIRAVYSENIRKCTTSFCTFQNILRQQWALTQVCLYEFFVWFRALLWFPDLLNLR